MQVSKELLECLEDETRKLSPILINFLPSHQRYFNNWIESAKTEQAKAKRIAKTIDAMIKNEFWRDAEKWLKAPSFILIGRSLGLFRGILVAA